ncbi:MAG: DUF4091 domain-containing protein [Planctomycetia bacterium]|nr:DUF4091 domain-containing protein [Planctomycetia bacterium]
MTRLHCLRFVICTILLLLCLWVDATQALCTETLRLPVTRDLWVSSAHGEEQGNNGATPRLKVKGYQEFSLLDFDVSPVRGKRITRARLHLTLAGQERLYRVGVSTITQDWLEGSGENYAQAHDASSFRWRRFEVEPWRGWEANALTISNNYSDITSVIFGCGGSFWRHSDATAPDAQGVQTVELDPDLVVARALGLSYGFVLFDDTGTELQRSGDNGEDVEIRLFPNRFLYSREQNRACQPWLTVEYEDPTEEELTYNSPQAPQDLEVDARDLPCGAATLRWRQGNLRDEHIIGYQLYLDGELLPPSQTPSPTWGTNVRQNDVETFETTLANLTPGQTYSCELYALDYLGRRSAPATVRLQPQTHKFQTWEELTQCSDKHEEVSNSFNNKNKKQLTSTASTWRDGEVAILDEFVKMDDDNVFIPSNLPIDYWRRNALWNADAAEITLNSARNEFIGFQLAFRGQSRRVKVKLTWDDPESDDATIEKADLTAQFYRYERVATPRGEMVDPTTPLDREKNIVQLRQGNDALYCEIFVPENAMPGVRHGRLEILSDRNEKFYALVDLTIWNFALPNQLSFFPEMNCYGLPENERDYYRLAQLHRTYINRVPYSHRGTVGDGLAPVWDAERQRFQWDQWRNRFGDYLDGSAFADLPRGSVPIEAFYLPIFENFPADVFRGFLGVNDWPEEETFTQQYRDEFHAGVVDFAREITENKWNQTRFFFFLNNKNDYKRNGWSRASSPWLLDEPASYRDFAALQFYGQALHNALDDAQARYNARADALDFRADISRPQWERDSLRGVLGTYVVATDVFKRYRAITSARVRAERRLLYLYGSTAAVHEDGYQPVLWSLDAWSLGADGVVPWQTIGTHDSWQTGDELSLFYPGRSDAEPSVVPSIRLKAYRRGQQDVEYLTLLQHELRLGREELANALREYLRLDDATTTRNQSEDAGASGYNASAPERLALMRREIGQRINDALPR